MKPAALFGPVFLLAAFGLGAPATPVNFTNAEMLGRPNDTSVTVNMMADEDIEAYFEYGTQTGVYSGKTATARTAAGTPLVAVLTPLQPNTRYVYRMRYRRPGETDFQARDEHAFRTRRSSASAYVFDIEADPHLDENSTPDLYRRTLDNILADAPDFLIDLGDTFFSEKQPVVNWDTVVARHLLFRTFFDRTCHSVPLFLALGNHEGEQGFRLDGTANCLPVWASKARLLYYPNPLPDAFYSGDSTSEPFVGLRQNYYSWEWGPALFVVLDPYWYQTVKSSTDNWTATLGEVQYRWLKAVLETSQARFKFVFCHQLVGGNTKDGRGGVEFAPYFEWGGKDLDGSDVFASKRPGWGMPVHQLMVKTGVTAFFHGHDHFYDKQDLDGIVYQLIPQPSHLGESVPNSAAEYGYTQGKILGGSGHLRVTVSPEDAVVEFVRARLPQDATSAHPNGEVGDSYSVLAKTKKGGVRR
jgi:hypothetical protein